MDEFDRQKCKSDHWFDYSDFHPTQYPIKLKKLGRKAKRTSLKRSDRDLFDYYLSDLQYPRAWRDNGGGEAEEFNQEEEMDFSYEELYGQRDAALRAEWAEAGVIVGWVE